MRFLKNVHIYVRNMVDVTYDWAAWASYVLSNKFLRSVEFADSEENVKEVEQKTHYSLHFQ